jgi:hypothetical protein
LKIFSKETTPKERKEKHEINNNKKNRNLVQNILPSKQMKKNTYTKQHVTSTKISQMKLFTSFNFTI